METGLVHKLIFSFVLTAVCLSACATGKASRINADAVDTAIKGQREQFKACHDQSFQTLGTGSGKVIVRFVYDETGAVTVSDIKRTDFSDPVFHSCILKIVNSIRFQGDGAPVTIIYPFKFNPHG